MRGVIAHPHRLSLRAPYDSTFYLCTNPAVIRPLPQNLWIQSVRAQKDIQLPAAWAKLLRDGVPYPTLEAMQALFEDIYADPPVYHINLERLDAGRVRLVTGYSRGVGKLRLPARRRIVLDGLQKFADAHA